MTTQIEMTFICHSRSSNVVSIESSYMSCYQWSIVTFANRHITHRFRYTKCFNAENHIFAYPSLVFDLEFEGHTIGMWRQNLVPENQNHGTAVVIKIHNPRSNHVGTVYECDRRTNGRIDRQTDRFTMTKTMLCIASQVSTLVGRRRTLNTFSIHRLYCSVSLGDHWAADSRVSVTFSFNCFAI